MNIKIGDKFKDNETNCEYILCTPNFGEIGLINTVSGKRFNKSVPVDNVGILSEKDFNRLTAGQADKLSKL